MTKMTLTMTFCQHFNIRIANGHLGPLITPYLAIFQAVRQIKPFLFKPCQKKTPAHFRATDIYECFFFFLNFLQGQVRDVWSHQFHGGLHGSAGQFRLHRAAQEWRQASHGRQNLLKIL